MKPLRVLLVTVLLAMAVVVPLTVRQRTAVELRGKERTLRFQAGMLAKFRFENNRFSNLVSRARNEQSLEDTELKELLRLRNQVAQLRRALKEMDQLRQELERMQDAVEKLRTNRSSPN